MPAKYFRKVSARTVTDRKCVAPSEQPGLMTSAGGWWLNKVANDQICGHVCISLSLLCVFVFSAMRRERWSHFLLFFMVIIVSSSISV